MTGFDDVREGVEADVLAALDPALPREVRSVV